MEIGTFEFILAIILISSIGGFLSNWMKAKHGYPITDDMGNVIRREEGTRAEAHEARIEALEKRIRVLERIATDRGADTAEQIEALRDIPPLEARERHEERR
ncbi:hypothetical protein WJT74_04110 [Sphingomicrobium sp. XHP0239]|uniref:hypothetical protein n=1 Tax=Sphingomicrobium maritimum TaxID=3133972 RepID=UPI0031CC4EA9